MVLDGGSTDATLDILRSYQDERLTWISEPDQGQSHAINKGLRRARGDVLTFLNSDDLLLPHAVAEIVQYFEAYPQADALYGDVQLIDATGKQIGQMAGKSFVLEQALTGGQPVTQQGSFWRRRVMEHIGYLDESLHFTMDLDYWLRIALNGFTLHYLPGTRAAFRKHGTSKSGSLQSGFLYDWQRMLDKIYHELPVSSPLHALKPESDAFVSWGWAKTYWQQRDYARARPLLRAFLGARHRRTRRMIATSMLIDSYLHTPFTRTLALLTRIATGREILYGDRRAV
jgi:glycosyltransferase involved in cell wall biosynthesis